MGALTSKPYAFTSRSWELKSVESIDIFDSYMSSVRYDYRGDSILRVLPVLNSNLNQEWISDKVRFFYDALDYQRLNSPWVRYSLLINYLYYNFSFFFERVIEPFSLPVGWSYALEIVRNTFSNIFKFYSMGSFNFYGFLGSFNDLKTVMYFKHLLNLVGNNFLQSGLISTEPSGYIETDSRDSFIFNQKGFFLKSGVILIGFNPRYESPILNIRIRDAFLNRKFKLYSIGANFITNYFVCNVGSTILTLIKYISGRNFLSLSWIEKNISILVGSSIFKFKNFYRVLREHFTGQDVFTFMPYASSLAYCEINSYPNQIGNIENHSTVFYNLSNDNLNVDSKLLLNFDNFLISNSKLFLNSIFHVYQGSHGDLGALNAHLILPSATHTESNTSYVNVLGKLKSSRLVLYPILSLVRSNISILKSILPLIKMNLNFLPLTMSNFNEAETNDITSQFYYQPCILSQFAIFSFYPFVLLQSFVNEFYLTDSLTRASKNLTIASLRGKFKSINFI